MNKSEQSVKELYLDCRHYIKYIDNLTNPNDAISEDELADLYTDGENIKNLEKQIYQQF